MIAPSKITANETAFKKKKTYLFVSSLGFFIVCILTIYILEFLPHFVTLPVNLPQDDYGPGSWSSITYSVLNPGLGRTFILRKYGYVGYANAENLDKLNAIKKYFYDDLTRLGWVAGNNYDLCAVYLPEAKLLVDSQKGYMFQFQEKSHSVYATGNYVGNLVCMAIIESNTSSNKTDQVYGIVLLTARQSSLMKLLEFIGGF